MSLRGHLLPVLITLALWAMTANPVTPLQALLAGMLLWIPCFAWSRWQAEGRSLLPLFTLIATAHWISFALFLFWGPQPADPIYQTPFGESTVTAVLAIAVIGMFALWAGMSLPLRPLRASALPDMAHGTGPRRYLYAILLGGMISSLAAVSLEAFGSGARQLLATLQTVVPMAVFIYLLQSYFRGTANGADRAVLLLFVAIRAVAGIASGWTGSVVSTGIAYCFVHISERRRAPVKLLLCIVPVFLFLQAGKSAFREAYWYGGNTGSIYQRAEFWMGSSWDAWSAALSNRDRHAKPLVAESLGRVSLLNQAGNVYDKTPRAVPFQYGRTYSYLAVTLIPRFLWPGKPSVNEANRFYQVAYGLTAAENLDRVSIAVGFVVEAYINFGWPGIAPLMFLLGILLGIFERTLLTPESGALFSCIGMALAMNLVTVESQAAQYVGGLVQQIVLTVAIFAPVIRRRAGRSAGAVDGVPAHA